MSVVRIARDGPVATLTLDHPPANHVDTAVVGALADALEALDAERAVRAVVLASAGRVFCGGADFATAPGGEPRWTGRAAIAPLYDAAARLWRTRKPIVCAVQGAAVGAGLGLALAADFRVAGPEARFSANFVKLGFHPGFGISLTLPRLIGEQNAALMLQTGRRIRAEQALAWGLVDELVPADRLLHAAGALAVEIAEGAPLAVESVRATARAGLAQAVTARMAHELAEQDRLIATSDFREGVRAVAERRAGAFGGS